jgi:acyl-CoA synthetase (AMP-forming)/AMP-acid ligase II
LSTLLPRTKFLQTFGTSETGIVQTKSLSSSSTFMTIDDPNVEWRIVDKELLLRAKGQIMGYLNSDQKAIHDGWFRTGDLVEFHNEKYFKIVGRKTEIINVGGEKVLPSEIEDLLMAIPKILDCTAYAVPNLITGQAVGVRIVAEAGADTKLLKKTVRESCLSTLEKYKVPSKVTFESSLKHTDRFKKER